MLLTYSLLTAYTTCVIHQSRQGVREQGWADGGRPLGRLRNADTNKNEIHVRGEFAIFVKWFTFAGSKGQFETSLSVSVSQLNHKFHKIKKYRLMNDVVVALAKVSVTVLEWLAQALKQIWGNAMGNEFNRCQIY